MEEIINKRFDENRIRQGLPTSIDEEGGDDKEDENEGHSINPSTAAYTPSVTTRTAAEDKSRKGSVDTRIRSLVTLINSTDDFFTTSTCSGRIILFTNESRETVPSSREEGSLPSKIKKKGCEWLLVKHEIVEAAELLDACSKALRTLHCNFTFKVEPAILHIQCRTLSNAKKLVHAATESGFRNSGMVIGKENRITVAVRSTLGIEVPFSTTVDETPITQKYITFLADKANEKMAENWRRMDKFTEEFSKIFINS